LSVLYVNNQFATHATTRSAGPVCASTTGQQLRYIPLWAKSKDSKPASKPPATNAQLIAMGEVTYVVDAVGGSVACLSRTEDGWQVHQGGPVALWDTIEHALTAWDANGRPGPETFHMVIDQHGQRIRHQTAPELSFTLP
jgi:hypothetical protein